MTMLLRLVRLLATCAGSIVLAHAATASGSEWSKSFTTTGTADLRLEVDEGRITLTGTDSKQVEVRVTATGWQIGPSGVQVIDRQAGDRVEVEVRVPHGQIFSVGNQRVRVEVRVPNGSAASIHTHDGAITAEAVKGLLRLKTGDGHIEASRVDGSLDANTGDGSVRVRGRLDSLMVHTGDGSIEAELTEGSNISTSWDLNTGDGHVTMRLPASFAADLDAHTGDGQIEVNFPVTTSGKVGGHDFRGKMNGGGPTLKIRTGDGGIKLLKL